MQHEKVTQFVEFCEGIPPDTEYQWDDAGVCALGQFCHYESHGWEREFLICNEVARMHPWSFGALAERVREEFGII